MHSTDDGINKECTIGKKKKKRQNYRDTIRNVQLFSAEAISRTVNNLNVFSWLHK